VDGSSLTYSGLGSRVTQAHSASGRAGIAAGYTGSRNNLDGRGSANVERTSGGVARIAGNALRKKR
jgi:hypothetical protein